jgi:YegS/Rv2252/BmrU family lipid kinase
MRNALVVFNYNAGRKQAVIYKKNIHRFLFRRCSKFKFVSIDEFEQTDLDEYDTIFAVGGDGTVNQVAKYLAGTNKTLAIIPSGTANLLAARLGIPANLNKALKITDKNNIVKIDAIDINNSPCFLRCGLGYDSDIICKTPQSLKNKFGYFAYFIAGIIFALRLKPKAYEMLTENKKIRTKATCVIIANASNMYRNFISVGQNSQLDDGYFDIFVLKAKNPVSFFYEFLRISFGIKKNNARAYYLKAKKLHIKNTWTACHIDGEKEKIKDDIIINNISEILKVYSI